MKRAMLTLVLATAVVVIGASGAGAAESVGHVAAAELRMGGQVNPFEFTITQTADSVTIRTPLSNPESVTLKLNGETPVQIGGGQGGMPPPRRDLPPAGKDRSSW